MMRMTMKMAAVSTITLLLLCCSVIASTDSQDGCDYAATNGNFTVPLHHRLAGSETLKWMHNDATIFHRRAQNKFSIGSKDDVNANGSLKLTNLKKSNAGKYTPEVFDNNGHAIKNLKSIQLCILDAVPKPTVKTACSLPSVKFVCTVTTPSKDLNLKWLQNNNVLEKENGLTLTRTAEQVVTDSFSCRVSNQINSMTSDPVKQPCFKPKSGFPKELFGINTWIFVGGGGGVVLVLIIVVIICCVRTKRRKRMQLKEEGELRLAWTNTDQQHQQHHQHNHPPDHQHHHHHHQQQPAGHTGPRQHRSKQHRDQQRPRGPDHPNGQPQPSPRRPAQGPRPADDEQPPPLPQPRKKAPKIPRV